jgi:endonuclease/exonuclease/phosphatase (EEP) superfamily protein YafD
MRRLTTVLIALASLGLLTLLLVVRLGSWTPRWWLDSLDTFALYAFFPFVGTLAAALVLRSKMLTAISIGAAVLYVHQFGVQTLGGFNLSGPTAAEAAPEVVQLRVLTLNAHASYDDPEPLIDLLTRWRPNVVILQEVSSQFARVVTEAIGGEYPFSFAAGLETEHEGSATWSRLPLGEADEIRLSDHGNFLHRVQVSTDAGDVWIFNVHLSNPTGRDHGEGRLAALRKFHARERDQELRQLVDQTTGLGAPFVLAGDFNTAAGSRAYRGFPDGWRDAFAEAGRGFGHTYPAPAHEREGDDWLKIPFPLLRIDYILTSHELRPRRAWTQEILGSDHFAVIADIGLPAR